MQYSARVGALVILFGAMLLGMAAVLQRSAFARQMTTYKVVFADAGGLTSGSRVTMSGVAIGAVQSVKLENASRALVSIAIESEYEIPTGSTAVLPSNLISVGDKELQILPGKGTPLAENSEIPGSLKSAISSLLPDSEKTMAEVNNTLKSIQKLLEDQDLKNGVKGTLASSQKMLDQGAITAEKFGRLAGRIDGLVAGNQKQFQMILKTTAVSLKNMETVSEQIKDLIVKGDYQKEALELMKSLKEAVGEGRNLIAELNKMASDPELKASLKDTTANFAKMSESGTKIAKDFESISSNGIEITKQTSELMTKANKLADEVGDLLGDFKKTVNKITGTKQDFLPEITAEAQMFHSQQDSNVRTDFTLTAPVGKDRLVFGLYDAFEGNKLNLQLQKTLDKGLDLRYGVYASKPGIGVDYRLAPNLSLRGDLFGLNDTRFDSRLKIDFGKNLQGWIGLERVFNKNTPVFGLGIRR